MKKLTALTLSLVLALTLAACGDENKPDGNTPVTAAPTTTAVAVPTNAADLPDSGKLMQLPKPFEAHAGDRAYFYEMAGNYVVYMYDRDEGELGKYKMYYAIFFGEDDSMKAPEDWFTKRVFATNAEAERYAALNPELTTGKAVAVENVVYGMRTGSKGEKYPIGAMRFEKKADVLTMAAQAGGGKAEIFDSKQ